MAAPDESNLPYRARRTPLRLADISLINVVLLPFRFAGAIGLFCYALTLAFSHVVLLKVAPVCADRYFFACCQRSSYVFLRVLGFEVVVDGLKHQRHDALSDRRYVVVANHVAVYDPWALMAALGPLAFVARRSLFEFPVVGAVLRALDAVAVDRRRRGDAGGARDAIAGRLRGADTPKWPLLVFPEGATTNGRGVIQFKTGAFAPLAPVLPVALRYACASGFDASYTDNQMSAGAVLFHFLRVLLERGKRVTVTVLPAAAPGDGATAADFAAAARAAILGALPDGADWADWDNARLRREWYGEDAAKVD